MSHYHLTYNIEMTTHPEGIPKEAVTTNGAADALLLVSIIGQVGNGKPLSLLFASKEGREDRELDAKELFEVWAALAHKLNQDPGIQSWRRTITEACFDLVREVRAGGGL